MLSVYFACDTYATEGLCRYQPIGLASSTGTQLSGSLHRLVNEQGSCQKSLRRVTVIYLRTTAMLPQHRHERV